MSFPVTSQRVLEQRFKAYGIIVVIVFIGLLLRLWYMQIIQGNKYATLSEGNRIRLIPVMAPRGKILDRNGKPMVASRMAFTISIIPQDLKDADKVITELAGILNMRPEEIRARVDSPGRRPFEPVRLKTDVDPMVVMKVEERRLDLPGVMVEEIPVRNYIYGEVGSHLFGYIGEIDSSELVTLKDKGYRAGDIIGKTGLERAYEEYLHGEDGGLQVEVNNLSRPIRVLGSKDPVPGNDIVLTIDQKLQQAADKALEEQLMALQKVSKTRNAKSGAVIALDPRTGEILAMVSKPSYDPNAFVKGITSEQWKELNNPLKPLTNRVVSGTYPPGSTYKVVTATAALELNKVTREEQFLCTGREPRYGKLCWIIQTRPRGHGILSFIEGIEESCNIVFYELGRRVGIENLATYARMFGLGKPTGLFFYPREKSGLVPDPEWKKANFSGYDRIWYPPETLDVAIGQGATTVTPIQLANVYVAVANGGTLYQPMLVKRIVSRDGQVIESFKPKAMGRVPVSPTTFEIVKEGLRAVVATGTASYAFRGFPIPVAGKTGSAQNPPWDSHGWFAGFAPADNPEIVVLALVEHGASGASAAAPVVRKVFEAYFGVEKQEYR